ncbi:MAG: PepSY-associated TM helix domain-containing protein, partial [Vicinamibacterales bacterium]
MTVSWGSRFSAVVKASLAGHAWLGLLAGGLMYLVCLSGTVAVFYEEFERWEQPRIVETDRYDPAIVQSAVGNVLQRLGRAPAHLYVSLPTPATPRTSVSTDDEHEAWFVNADGTLGEPVAHDWTHLLLNLHIYLHLPSTVGLLLVGAAGAMLCGLIISGFLAHPRIVKDAFRLRLGGSPHLEQVDLHNRLSVWGAPFHIVIALSGAYFGLASVMFALLAGALGAVRILSCFPINLSN